MDIDVNAIMHHFVLADTGMMPNKALVWLVLAAGVVLVLFSYTAANMRLVPGRLQLGVEGLVVYVRDGICVATMGHDGEKFLPLILSLFVFVASCNLLGLIPAGHFAYSVTGNLNVTGTLAVFVLLIGMFVGIRAKGPIGFFIGLVPHGVPWVLWPLMFLIEFISLFAKHFALMVRLFANVFAGHIVLLVFASMAALMVGSSIVGTLLGVLPFAMTVIMTAFEIFVALLQAFIFTILSALYIGQAMGDH